MRLWGYYAWHTFWNTIKKMFRSTFLVIILAIFGFGIIFGLIGGVVGSMVEKQQSLETVESSSEADRALPAVAASHVAPAEFFISWEASSRIT